LLTALGDTLDLVRRYPEAELAYRRALRILPDSDSVQLRLAFLYEQWKGDTGPAKKLMPEIARRLDPGGRFAALTWVIVLMWHNPLEAQEVLRQVPAEMFLDSRVRFPRELLAAFAHESLGDVEQARKEYQAALPKLEAEVRAQTQRSGQHSVLALAQAALGHKEDALREARRGVELQPLSSDAIYGVWPMIDLAIVEARCGEIDAAIEQIRQLLAAPTYLSAGLLRVDPRWAPLHGDARFRQMAEMDAQAVRSPAPVSK
jgi:tetratricopeptide (TPR) repeat protein